MVIKVTSRIDVINLEGLFIEKTFFIVFGWMVIIVKGFNVGEFSLFLKEII